MERNYSEKQELTPTITSLFPKLIVTEKLVQEVNILKYKNIFGKYFKNLAPKCCRMQSSVEVTLSIFLLNAWK